MYGKKFPATTTRQQLGNFFRSRRRVACTNRTHHDRRLPMRRDPLRSVPKPESTVCHCRMCQKAVGGPFAALCKVTTEQFRLDPRPAGQLPEFIRRRTAFLRRLRHAADLPLSGRRRHRGHHRQPRQPGRVPITKNFGTEVASALDRPARPRPTAGQHHDRIDARGQRRTRIRSPNTTSTPDHATRSSAMTGLPCAGRLYYRDNFRPGAPP